MNNTLTIPVFLFLWVALLPTELFGQSDSPDAIEWEAMERALERSEAEEKLILIDVYAAWCPYCQRMQSEVYPSDEVEEAIQSYFIPVRINIESDRKLRFQGREFTEAEFAKALRYQSVPTTFFMNSRGEVVGQQPGFLPVDTFSSLLRFVGTGAYETQRFQDFEGD
ncbi:MAG: thioredoxin fold domain-containing protein [Balneolaceae bacterium]